MTLDFIKNNFSNISTIDNAIAILQSHIDITPRIQSTIEFSIKAHEGQTRKSGEPYIIHPILVASILAYFTKDEDMIISALLHDVVEDTNYDIEHIQEEYGQTIAHLVDGLTKIVEIRVDELSNDKLISSALTFRKILLASIKDPRILIIKLCDRLHNMLTLDALDEDKQKKISKETLIVYAPIAHRLGISYIKNSLEDLSFSYLYPDEYNKIDTYMKQYEEKSISFFNDFTQNTRNILYENGYDKDSIKIAHRAKNYYSIYLKMQRKGVSIDEIFDLFAIRILCTQTLECYNILGLIHTSYAPLISRFKDYISMPKENGYQTIHSTVFHNSKIFEVQIRTKAMNKTAEYGIAAHWLYKGQNIELKSPNLKWLDTFKDNDDTIEEFYSNAKQDLFIEDIMVYSPKGKLYTLPKDVTAFDFAYAVHTDIGNYAQSALINKVKKPLLTKLNSGDIVKIITGKTEIPRCSWENIVTTSKAKKSIKQICHNKIKDIQQYSGKNILNTIFPNITYDLHKYDFKVDIQRLSHNLDYLKNIKQKISPNNKNIKLKTYEFENVYLHSNKKIKSLILQNCCHPKFGDDIVAILNKKEATLHHKFCENAYEQMKQDINMVHCSWIKNKFFTYKMVISIPNTRGELARLLTHLSNHKAIILFIEYGKDKHSDMQYCKIDFEIENDNYAKVKQIVSQKAKIIEFNNGNDAYKN